MKRVVVALAALSLCTAVYAQYATGFEPPVFVGSAGGTIITGQDGFYLPPVASSTDGLVYTYAGNLVGIPPHPTGGGEQFEAGVNTATLLARAQRDVTWGTGKWTMAADVCANYIGTLPAAQNLGSMSASQADMITYNFIMLARWTDPNTAQQWNADFVYFDAVNTAVTAVIPDVNFQNLPIQHWYRWSTQVDYDTNKIEQIQLTDLSTATTFTYNPTGWYMRGGSSGLVQSTNFRMFAGGIPNPGNVFAFDNVNIVPEPAGLLALGLGLLVFARRR